MEKKGKHVNVSGAPPQKLWVPSSRLSQALLLVGATVAALLTTSSELSASSILQLVGLNTTAAIAESSDPSSQWKDDVWPIREQTPWDISTDYPFPRKLEYDVTEGTWLRLDVHPKTGEIVFDMLGDLYCLPADAYSSSHLASSSASHARPILLGVPHDSDPHFSPEGDRLVFRSDAGLGVENIWVMEWNGCDNMNVRSEGGAPDLLDALKTMDEEDELLANGTKETEERKQRRLTREGRIGGTCRATHSEFTKYNHDSPIPLHSPARHKRDVPVGIRRKIPSLWHEDCCHKMVHIFA